MSKIVIVIVTYNSSRVIEGLLESIPAALDGLPAEVVIVDNDSTDGTGELLAERLDCQVIRAANKGYSAGINRGVAGAEASGDILILNPDIRLGLASIRSLVETMQLPATGIVAPKVLNEDGSLFRSLRRRPTIWRAAGLNFTGLSLFSEYVDDVRAYERPAVADWALGAALLVSRACFEQLHGWDESFFLYSEETDFCLRASDVGLLTRFCPASTVLHIGGESGQNDTTHTMQIVNRVRFYARRHSRLPAAIYFGLTIFSEFTWYVRGHRQSAAALRALLRPTARPIELNAAASFVPR